MGRVCWNLEEKGPKSAPSLSCSVFELDTVDHKKVASLVGLSLSWSSGLKVSYGHSRSLSIRARLSEGSGFPLSDKVKKEGAVKKVPSALLAVQGTAKRWSPGCVNAPGKARQQW